MLSGGMQGYEGVCGLRGDKGGRGDPNIPEKLQIKSTLYFDFERQVCCSFFFFCLFFFAKIGIKK